MANHHPAPLDMSRIPRYPYPHSAGFDLFSPAGFADSDAPLFSAGLSATSNMWGSNMLTPTYNIMPQNMGSFFDFPNTHDQGEQSLDHVPNLVIPTSREVSEADEGHPPEDFGPDRLFRSLDTYESKRIQGHTGIMDEVGDVSVNFDNEFLAMGYGETSAIDEAAGYHYWTPSP
jgi:hypothetical protein